MGDSNTLADKSILRLTPKQLATMMERARQRERVRVAEELHGFAVFEESVGHIEAATVLRTIADGMHGEAAPAPKTALSPEQVQAEASRLLVPGMESLPFPGYDAGLVDDTLPPAVEHSDAAEMGVLVRKLGA